MTRLSLAEEKVRWENIVKGVGRAMWEAMRPEVLEEQQVVANPEAFVEGIEDLVVCHCDQVPMWLRLGSARQLFTADEVMRKGQKRKLHEAKKAGEVQAKGNEAWGRL